MYLIDNFISYSEVIGYEDNIESPRIVSNNQQYKVFKFYLNNGTVESVSKLLLGTMKLKRFYRIMPNYVNIYIF